MALEVASFIGQLDKAWPVTGDQIAQGDDQIRLLKATLQKTFPGMQGEVMRVLGKAAGFTPSVDESTVIYNCTAAVTVTLPALGGVVAGTYWFVNAGSGAVTLTPSSTETVNGAATVTVASGTWALITKASSTNWVALGIPAMTAAAIVAALGSMPVAKAADADKLDGYDSANFVRTVNSLAPTSGNVVVQPFAATTALLFVQASAPIGWTKQTTHNDKSLRVVSGTGGGSGGVQAFSTVFGRMAVDASSLSVAQLASHNHVISTNWPGGLSGSSETFSSTNYRGGTLSTQSAGSGSTHSHGLDLRVQYVDVIICTKD